MGTLRPRVNRLAVSAGEQGLPPVIAMLNAVPMDATPADRIEQALARIEKAAAARAYSAERLARRHAVLRERIQDAVTSLDALIAREKRDEVAEGGD